MTKQEFFCRFKKVSDKTFNGWFEKGYLPGAVKIGNDWDIPDRAWPPYTEARANAKNANKIMVSIVRGCIMRRRPFADIYKCSQAEFDMYIDTLVDAGLIKKEQDNGIDYYYATPKSQSYTNNIKELEKYIITLVGSLVESAAKGFAEGLATQFAG